jgi:FixJ family two-component response regulator
MKDDEIPQQKSQPTLVMVTCQGNVKVAVEAMRCKAVDFLEKPFLREHFLTPLFPRADGARAEYEARPIAV